MRVGAQIAGSVRVAACHCLLSCASWPVVSFDRPPVLKTARPSAIESPRDDDTAVLVRSRSYGSSACTRKGLGAGPTTMGCRQSGGSAGIAAVGGRRTAVAQPGCRCAVWHHIAADLELLRHAHTSR